MTTMREEIIELSEKWYRYVGLDHHKDRDCHWYIETAYSYGQQPTYQAMHNGYRHRDWTGEKRQTYTEAEWDLLVELRLAIADALKWAERESNDPESWVRDDAREALEVLTCGG